MVEVEEFNDPQAVLEFLETNHYPYPWSVESLALHRSLKISVDDELAGFLWFWKQSHTTLQIHVCMKPAYQGKWISKAALKKLFDVGRACGSTHVIGLIDRPAIERLYRRLGARIAGPFAILDIPGHDNGLYGSQDLNAPSAPSASARADQGSA